MKLSELINDRINFVDEVINSFLPIETEENKRVVSAIRYMMLGGKRIRPILMLESYRLFGYKEELDVLSSFMFAIEAIHTYSLIHDDLPCMDNSDERRGILTCHRKYDEATALLAGDALLNLSMEILLTNIPKTKIKMDRVLKAMNILYSKSGVYGMIAGQEMDLYIDNIDENKLLKMYELKTSALIEASIMIGAYLGEVELSSLVHVKDMAHSIGIIFQLTDDLLDIEEDKEFGKKTIASVYGEKKTGQLINEHKERAFKILDNLVLERDNFFKELISSLIKREV